jgi:hypothetical protein
VALELIGLSDRPLVSGDALREQLDENLGEVLSPAVELSPWGRSERA